MKHASTDRAAERAAQAERDVYNAAFHELGLPWHWDDDTFATLQALPCPRQRVRWYVETRHPHLLRAYDSEFLARAVESQITIRRREPG